MRTKSYEGKSPDEIREILTSGEISRSTHYRIRRNTGINACEKTTQPADAYEVNKGQWV